MKDIFYILSHRTISPWLDRHHVYFSLADTIVNHPYFSLMVHFELTGTMFAGDVIFLYDSTRGFIQCKTTKQALYAIYPFHMHTCVIKSSR